MAVRCRTWRQNISLGLSIVFLLILGFSRLTVAQNSVTYVYDQDGRVVGVIDPSGNAAAYTYDSVGNLLSITRYASTQVSIVSFSPQSGAAGTTVTIYGTGFSATPSQDTVSFNGVAATITSATTNILVASVPAGATTGAITVTAPAGSATSSNLFTVTTATSGEAPPVISGFTPAIGTAGTIVTISGTGFQTTTANNVVHFNLGLAQVESSNSTSIATTVSAQGTSGRISVSTPYGKADSTDDFFVPPSPYIAADVGFTGRMEIGGTTTVTIGTAGQIGLVVFDGTAGQRVSVNLTNGTFPSCSTNVAILNPDGSTLFSQGCIGSSGFIEPLTLPVTGTYTIFVQPPSNDSGNITVALYNVVDQTGTITTDGTGVGVNLTDPGQNAYLTFSGTAGQRVSVNFTNANFDGWWGVSILNPDGSTLSSNSTTGCCSDPFIDTVTLSTAGTYTVKVDPINAATGSVTVAAYTIVDQTGTITADGTGVGVSLADPGQNAYLTFSGTAGQRVSVNMTNPNFNGCWYVDLLNPDGSTLSSNNKCGNGDPFIDAISLPSTGTYTVEVDPIGPTTGSVTVAVYTVVDQTGTITTDGTGVGVNLADPGQNAYLTFSGTAGQRVSVDFTNVNFNGWWTVSILNPDGSTLSSNTFTSCCSNQFFDTMTLSTAGTYTVKVDPNGPATGSATVAVYTVVDQTGTVTINGASLPVTITNPGQNAEITFSGTASESATVKLTANTICTATVSLLPPGGGSALTSTSSCSSSFNLSSQTLPSTGTYTISIDPQGASTGSISVAVTSP